MRMEPKGVTKCGLSGFTTPDLSGVRISSEGGSMMLSCSFPSSTRIRPHTPAFVRCSPRKAAGSDVSSKTGVERSEEHTSELQSLMRISYAVLCWKNKSKKLTHQTLTRRQTT